MKAEVRRFTDHPPEYTLWQVLRRKQLLVRCPRCNGSAIAGYEKEMLTLRCECCYQTIRYPCSAPDYAVKDFCAACGRWMNLSLPEAPNPHAKTAVVVCPYCGSRQSARIVQTSSRHLNPQTQLRLYFSDSYRGQPVWALNRAHLRYLIAYVEATLRQKGRFTASNGEDYFYRWGQEHQLPKFMKLAKNRAGLLKLLRRMQSGG